MQYVGFEYQGKLIPFNEKAQGGMQIKIEDASVNANSKDKKAIRIHLRQFIPMLPITFFRMHMARRFLI